MVDRSEYPSVRVQMELDDGSLSVPRSMVESLNDEYDARGRLTVSQAQVLVEKWGKAQGDRA